MSLLDVCNLKVEFKRPDGAALPVLDIPLFVLEEGSQVCIKGRSGSGKTSFLNVISGILAPNAGKILLDGVDIAALKEVERDLVRGRKIGFIFQTFNLLSGFTVLENVLLGAVFGGDPNEEDSSTRNRANTLLERVGLADRIHHRPRLLSSGEQQRVAIARALINRPKLILADEPTGSLDEKSSGEAMDLMLALCSDLKSSLLLVTHDPSVMARFAKVIDLKELNRIQ